MNRRILLLEPPYKNKYPPMGLMKLSTYFRQKGDTVRFFKGNLKDLAARLLCEEFLEETGDKSFGRYSDTFTEYIKTGKHSGLEAISDFYDFKRENDIMQCRKRMMNRDYPKFDIIAVTTLFTFYWKETIETINGAKEFLAENSRLLVGGVAASLVPEEIERETGITPVVGLLDKPGMIDEGDPAIIDHLPLDYSILEETDYVYPMRDAYFAYTTRGCIRHCDFCAVPILEPEYEPFIPIHEQVHLVDECFGPRKDLLLMDNNVLASSRFDEIIEEIKACGFAKGATYTPRDEYDIALDCLKRGLNPYAYIRKILSLYDLTASRLRYKEAGEFYIFRENHGLLYSHTAETEDILEADAYFRPIYSRYFRPVKRSRYVDFNQGIDARLVTAENMKKLSEINIRPLRIAFDHYSQRDIYERAVRLAVEYDIKDLSNYLLYNFHDEPIELYRRMLINVELCEKLNVKIYSFPMKYHPVQDPAYFRTRDYIGTHWNRKFIRAVQAVMNSTKGKIGRGKEFFEAAFGKTEDEFYDILYMPETFIIYRRKYEHNLAEEWCRKFHALSEPDILTAKRIIEQNHFTDPSEHKALSPEIQEVLSYYYLDRE